MIFSNMCAEINENIKEAVLQRGHFLEYFSMALSLNNPTESDVALAFNLPWALFNIYCQNITKYLDQDEQYIKGLSLIGSVLSHLEATES